MQPSFAAAAEPRELESDPRLLMIDSVVEAACRAVERRWRSLTRSCLSQSTLLRDEPYQSVEV